jgi:hypothetical protein
MYDLDVLDVLDVRPGWTPPRSRPEYGSLANRRRRITTRGCTYERCYESSAPGMLLAGFWTFKSSVSAVWKVPTAGVVAAIFRVMVRVQGDVTEACWAGNTNICVRSRLEMLYECIPRERWYSGLVQWPSTRFRLSDLFWPFTSQRCFGPSPGTELLSLLARGAFTFWVVSGFWLVPPLAPGTSASLQLLDTFLHVPRGYLSHHSALAEGSAFAFGIVCSSGQLVLLDPGSGWIVLADRPSWSS